VDQVVREPSIEATEREDQFVFSAKVIEQAQNPEHRYRMVEPDAYGVIHGCCGDTIEVYLRLAGDRISEATFMTDGREPAIACGSTLTTMVQGMSLEEAVRFLPEDLITALDGLPRAKTHCASLAVKALQEAIAEWFADSALRNEVPLPRQRPHPTSQTIT
jgi:nitrogen fixation NifU-like protein